jgi:hypothetical protein
MPKRNNEKDDSIRNPYRRAIIKTLNNSSFSKEDKYDQSYLDICGHVLENVGFRGTKKTELLEIIEVKRKLLSLQTSTTKEIDLESLEKIYKFGLIDLKYKIKRSKSVEIKKQESVKNNLIKFYQKHKNDSIETNIIIPSQLVMDLIKINEFHIRDVLGKQKKYFKEQVGKLKSEARVAIEGYREGWWS